jgi:broad specificity phosphatase PhoE
MSTTLFLMRHGATQANLAQPPRLQGQRQNLPLSPSGILQARAAREQLRKMNLSAIYSSPLRRATETAAIIAEELNVTPQTECGLMECDVGTWEGMDWQSIRYFDAHHYARFMNDPEQHGFPRGETFLALFARVKQTIDLLQSRHPGESILIVSHYTVNRVYLAGIEGLHLDQQAIAALDSGTISVIRREENQLHYDQLEIPAVPRESRRAA